jgi:hypothetical protein
VWHIDQCLGQKHYNGARAVRLRKNIATGFVMQFTTADRSAHGTWHCTQGKVKEGSWRWTWHADPALMF